MLLLKGLFTQDRRTNINTIIQNYWICWEYLQSVVRVRHINQQRLVRQCEIQTINQIYIFYMAYIISDYCVLLYTIWKRQF